jgi:hypothetical protein
LPLAPTTTSAELGIELNAEHETAAPAEIFLDLRLERRPETTKLRLARAVVQAASETRALPALDELAYRIDNRTAQIERALNSSDEIGIIAFLRAEVESLLDHLATFGPGVRERIAAYRSGLDARLGTVYHRRRLFEESVTGIAESISSYLDLEEQAAQGMFPHYFEKQKTDGVDYQMYVGPGLLEDGWKTAASTLCA